MIIGLAIVVGDVLETSSGKEIRMDNKIDRYVEIDRY